MLGAPCSPGATSRVTAPITVVSRSPLKAAASCPRAVRRCTKFRNYRSVEQLATFSPPKRIPTVSQDLKLLNSEEENFASVRP